MITYTNLEAFEKWVKKTAKNYNGNIQDYLDELETTYMNSGYSCYELRSYETTTGHTECYSYDVIDTFDGDEFIGREFIF